MYSDLRGIADRRRGPLWGWAAWTSRLIKATLLAIGRSDGVPFVLSHIGEDAWDRGECTQILALEGFRVQSIEWADDGPNAKLRSSDAASVGRMLRLWE